MAWRYEPDGRPLKTRMPGASTPRPSPARSLRASQPENRAAPARSARKVRMTITLPHAPISTRPRQQPGGVGAGQEVGERVGATWPQMRNVTRSGRCSFGALGAARIYVSCGTVSRHTSARSWHIPRWCEAFLSLSRFPHSATGFRGQAGLERSPDRVAVEPRERSDLVRTGNGLSRACNRSGKGARREDARERAEP